MIALPKVPSRTIKLLDASPFPMVIHVVFEEHKTHNRLSDYAHSIAVDLVAHVMDRPVDGLGVVHAVPSGRPVVSGLCPFENCSISVSHTAGQVAVAASIGSTIVGIDVVRIADAAPSIAWCIQDDELPHDDLADAFLGRAKVWAAKEAAFKASFVDEPFRPRRISIACRGDRSFAWRRLTDLGWESGSGLWLIHDHFVVAVAAQGAEREEITIVDYGIAEAMHRKVFCDTQTSVRSVERHR